MSGKQNILFLPGAAGAPEFWHGVGERLPAAWNKTYLAWPGLGNQAHRRDVNGLADLVALAESAMNGPTVLVAQSMGGVVAIRLALRHPERITRLVLTATSGGLDMAALGGGGLAPKLLGEFPGRRPLDHRISLRFDGGNPGDQHPHAADLG